MKCEFVELPDGDQRKIFEWMHTEEAAKFLTVLEAERDALLVQASNDALDGTDNVNMSRAANQKIEQARRYKIALEVFEEISQRRKSGKTLNTLKIT